jgi:ATP-dependent helicase HrpA
MKDRLNRPKGPVRSEIEKLYQKVHGLLPQAMLYESYFVQQRLQHLSASNLMRKNPARAYELLQNLEARLKKSAKEKEARCRKKPRPFYPPELPITKHHEELVKAIKNHRVIIVSGETGCGKSTQLPKMCLEAGRGLSGKIACTQPRRIAAITIAQRIAEELREPLGKSVGYKIRFQDTTSPETYIKILTDGMLLAETQGDRLLAEYDTIIIDEAHERSLNIDFLLGLCQLLLDKRPELKLIITSATLEVEKFVRAFHEPPVFQVSGRLYPVEVMYFQPEPLRQKKEEPDYVDLTVEAVGFIKKEKPGGDILVFMPTEQDILETCQRLSGKNYPDAVVLPLFARMPSYQQKQIYSIKQGKIVVATNVAETSLTIPAIRYVVDTGLARLSQYQPSSGIHSLPITLISRASAEQRKGRCGRVSEGLCLRLYPEEDFLSRLEFTPPEILRSNLAEVILRMLDLNLGDPLKFLFIDPPSARSVSDGYRTLIELGAVVQRDGGYELTSLGEKMARLPLDPRLSRMLLEAEKQNCLKEVAIIASVLSIRDPRERPLEKAADADRVQSIFQHPESDFLTFVNLWDGLQAVRTGSSSSASLKKFARDYFLSYVRLREWMFVYEQIISLLEEQKIRIKRAEKVPITPELYSAIHKSILSGFISHIAAHKEKNIYEVARGHEAMLWPGSAVFKKAPDWVVAAEVVRTNRLYLRTVARISPEWAEELAKHLCHYSYEKPYWDKSRGEVRAKERVTLFGLTIVSGRDVSYGQKDPEASHKIFVEEALIKNRVSKKFPFIEHNQRLVEKVRQLEEKLRQRNILVAEDYLFNFYSGRLQEVFDLDGLERRIKNAGSDEFLWLKEENLYLTKPEPQKIEQFPDKLKLRGHTFKLAYRFAPGEEDDGVTVLIPASLISEVPEELLTWPVSGMLQEKIEATLKALPKEYRKLLHPLSEKVELIASELKPANVSFFTCLASFLKERLKVDVPKALWEKLEIPRYLKMRIAVVNENGQEILSGRDLDFLRKMLSSRAQKPVEEESPGWREAKTRWERQELAGWEDSFAEIPEEIAIDDFLKGFPALIFEDGKFGLKLFKSKNEALTAHVQAAELILTRQFQKDLNFIQRSYAFSEELKPALLYFGGETAIKNEIISRVKKEVFQQNFRTKAELQAFIKEKALKQIFEKSHQVFTAVAGILEEYRRVRELILSIKEKHKKLKVSSTMPEILREELERLVPKSFLAVYPADFLSQLPRMVRALGIRAERARLSAEKDRAKAAQVEPFLAEYQRLTRLAARKKVSPQEERLIFELQWMIEEFKISLFAPEIKTAFPVSAKRLAGKIKEIKSQLAD